MPEATVAAGFARSLMELAVSKGASRKALAERSRIAPAELQDQDNRIPFAKYVALMRAGQELCDDPALALHFGERFDLSELSIVGLVGGASESMADAFAQMNRYARLAVDVGLGPDDCYRLERRGSSLWIVDTRRTPNNFPELMESSFARMVCTSRRYLPGTQIVKAIHFTHAEPSYRAEYERVFQAPVIFASDKNALLTDDAWLKHKSPSSSRYALGVLSAHAEKLAESLDRSESTKGRVEKLLIPVLHTGDANVETISRQLGLSRQTLFRRLRAESTTFESVLDELRHKLALHYLNKEKVSVGEAAYRVGFSDPAAFSRAFKRWTGTSPRRLRPKV